MRKVQEVPVLVPVLVPLLVLGLKPARAVVLAAIWSARLREGAPLLVATTAASQRGYGRRYLPVASQIWRLFAQHQEKLACNLFLA